MPDAGRCETSGTLTLTVTGEGRTVILGANGEVDLGSWELLASELEQATSGGAERIVVDLSGLAFIDSVGIRLLIEAEARARANGSRLEVRKATGGVHRTLSMIGLLERLGAESPPTLPA